jgi:hypothetical protein
MELFWTALWCGAATLAAFITLLGIIYRIRLHKGAGRDALRFTGAEHSSEHAHPALTASATTISSSIGGGVWTSTDVTQAFVRQARRVNTHLNSICWSRFGDAEEDALFADKCDTQGQ